jgi:thioredoxin-related protein
MFKRTDMNKLLGMFLLVGTLISTNLFAEEIAWVKDINNAFELAQKEQKTVMVLVEGENCRWCKKMKHRTLADENVQKKLKSYITVKVMREDDDAVKDLPIIDGVPSVFFMSAEKKVIESVIGYFNIEDFLSYISDVEKKTLNEKK